MKGNRMKLIAETAWHHQGDFRFMEKLVSDIITRTDADILKLHLTLNLEEYMADDHPIIGDIRNWLFSPGQWEQIIKAVVSSEKDLMLLFNDTDAVEFGMPYNPALVEVHSVCLNDENLLACLRSSLSPGTKIVLGVGGTSLDELETAIHTLDSSNIVLMFGFQNYPTKYQDINFAKMRKIMGLYPEFEFGYADHTAWDEPDNTLITLFGAALGMAYVEKHVTNAFGQERADWSAAVNVETFNILREKMRLLDACSGDGLLLMNKGEQEYSVYGPMKKAGVLNQDVSPGQNLNLEMLCFKRTGQTSDLSQVEVLQSMGREIVAGVKKGQVLLREHLK